ncbi:MAG: glycosyltransferase family 4 protein [Pyrinomonadaceae bacterium]
MTKGKQMDIPFILQVTREIGLGGGSESVAFELHRAWLALGVDARVLTSQVTEPDAEEGIILAATWLKNWGANLRGRHLAMLVAVPLFTLIASWRLWRSRGSKIVLSHGDSLVGDVCIVHSVNRACLAEKQRMGSYAWLFNPINLWVAWRDSWMFGGKRYRRVVAISERVRRELKEHYHVPDDQIVTIPNGINLARFNPRNAKSRDEVRRSLGVPVDAPMLLFVGSRYRIKGLRFAIMALAEMQTKAFLVIVGNDKVGRYKALAEKLGVGDRVIFAGARSDLPKIYPAADAFVLPTLYETFALVCLEAMASGVPVVASPAGGIEDYLHDGVNGFHIRHDPPEIAAKLDRLLNDPELHARIREAGLRTAGNYSWDTIAAQYLNLFAELVGERAGKMAFPVGQPLWSTSAQGMAAPAPNISIQGI